jgi:hypothetical protein
MGPIYGSHPIGLLYFIGPWTLDPHPKRGDTLCLPTTYYEWEIINKQINK